MTTNNFEVKYTLRLYEPALITELATQYEKSQKKYKNKNEFFTHIIELGLKANRAEMISNSKKKPAVDAEESDVYLLLMEIFKYMSNQFKKIYIDHNIFRGLICTMYNILAAMNIDERLYDGKVESGFYDDLPPRFTELIEDLKRRYSLD